MSADPRLDSDARTRASTPRTTGPSGRSRVFGDGSPPDEVREGVALLLALSDRARREIWSILAPCIAEPIPREIAPEVDHFCRAHAIDGGDLARGLRAARALVRTAARLDLDGPAFAAELDGIGGPVLVATVLPGYEQARGLVRLELARAALEEHGKTLEDVRFRVDTLTFSDREPRLGIPYVVLTLIYREGGEKKQVTFQVLPHLFDKLADLRDRLFRKKEKRRVE